MATLNDVAKKANVSKMTVSRVINHPTSHRRIENISDTSDERIELSP